MPLENFIDVRVLVNNRPLTEYPETNDDDNEGDKRTCYVEAVTGQQFSVSVTILPGFRLHSTPYLYVQMWVDDANCYLFYSLPYNGFPCRKDVVALKQKFDFTGVRAKDERGEWKLYPYTFGALGISEFDAFEHRRHDFGNTKWRSGQRATKE